MMQRHLDHRETDAHPSGPHGDGCPEDERIGIGDGAIEMVLGQPHGIETDRFSQFHFPQGVVDDLMILTRVMADGEHKRTESHAHSPRCPLPLWPPLPQAVLFRPGGFDIFGYPRQHAPG